jgi:hypothetical protein
MPIPQTIVQAFATSIWAKVCLLRDSDLEERHKLRVRESISEDIKKYTDCIPPRVSDAAKTAAKKLDVNLSVMGWHDQPRFDRGRKLFHLEHITPVSAIREECLSAQSMNSIEIALNSAKVAWILKSEDRKLT